eukprot:gene4383-4804_t
MSRLLSHALTVALLVILLAVLPVKFLLPKRFLMKKAHRPHYASDLLPYDGPAPPPIAGVDLRVSVGPLGFLLVVEPTQPLDLSSGENLTQWHLQNTPWLRSAIARYGGILCRGFPSLSPSQLDVLAVDWSGRSEPLLYLDSEPRARVAGTNLVSSLATQPQTVLPLHLERSAKWLLYQVDRAAGMAWLADFPAAVANLSATTETMNVFQERGLLFTRRLRSLSHSNSLLDVFAISRGWQDIFGSENKMDVHDRVTREEGLSSAWDGDDLVLSEISHSLEATTRLGLLHGESALAALAYNAQLQEDPRALIPYFHANILLQLQEWRRAKKAVDVVYADDQSQVDLQHALSLREALSSLSWAFNWEDGDFLILDNLRLAHGHLPRIDGNNKTVVGQTYVVSV